jgi:hypothetical protein
LNVATAATDLRDIAVKAGFAAASRSGARALAGTRFAVRDLDLDLLKRIDENRDQCRAS